MSSVQAILLAICVWCGSSSPASAKEYNVLECYASQELARRAHPEEHLRHKGTCWHIGHWKDGISTVTKTPPKKTSHVASSGRTSKKIHLLKVYPPPEWNSGATTVDYPKFINMGDDLDTLWIQHRKHHDKTNSLFERGDGW